MMIAMDMKRCVVVVVVVGGGGGGVLQVYRYTTKREKNQKKQYRD